MRRLLPIVLSVILAMGGLCSGFCFGQGVGQASGGTAHSCCHGKDRCGHAAPAMQSHAPMVIAGMVPVILTEPIPLSSFRICTFQTAAQPYRADFTSPPQASVLRL